MSVEAMMDIKLKSTHLDEKMDDGNDDKPTTAPKTPIGRETSTAGSLALVTSCSEQISTEDTELSSADISMNIPPNITTASKLHDEPKCGPVSICSPCSVEKQQPRPLCALLPSSTEACAVHEVSHSFASVSRSHKSLRTTTVSAEPSGDDLCAAILLACLFCHPLDCFLATVRGCQGCVWSLCSSLCSSLCGCEPATLQPLLDVTRQCDLCRCLGVRCFLCDCPACEICLQATECLDLAMEISQMLYH